ncbi:rho GTPase-activating protein SYDE2-like [Sinocyclocheilus grahami]|uniref:rho GTPase-activating protein SYDE2-like n=1 Tax=Sinocyclocheilus grahami TaxID=75366 RepID=UPI0007AD5C89|nr:PREDICTED: rho GTPase-activating protein SYDE2-like [Sinocyclocheilus grahami]
MAEPLLKRTFSRLRAKERFRRKTDPKLTEVTGKVDLFQSSSSTASTSGHAETESSTVEECTRRSQITVSKKQNWAKLPSTSKDPANTDLYIIRAESLDLIVLQSDCISSASGVKSDSPGAQKKSPGEGGSGSSVIDKIKSPGTVRRLSMKMRKLPELRRKLSLRSSRNQRNGQGNAGSAPGASDEASPPNARKESSNVISKYHLDSSAPARPRRRSSRTRSASKGGYLSDGDSPELLPKQGSGQGSKGSPTPPPHHGPQDSLAVADAESFRLYSLADHPRCAQRLSGLLTVHLLGVDELLRSPRNDATKEVFCAIQVDGVTRARTSLLTCRGACLPLNHTFNLELERARLLKLVILTPTNASGNDASAALAATARNRVCCLGAVAIPHLFKGKRTAYLQIKSQGEANSSHFKF